VDEEVRAIAKRIPVPQVVAGPHSRNPNALSEHAHASFPVLDVEPLKKWEQVTSLLEPHTNTCHTIKSYYFVQVAWIHDATIAKEQAQASGRPIFVEMVV
jgi:hypothetical protein